MTPDSPVSASQAVRRRYLLCIRGSSLPLVFTLGIVIGRVGDLIIGDHLGKPTSWFLAWSYHGGTLAPPFTCGVTAAIVSNE